MAIVYLKIDDDGDLLLKLGRRAEATFEGVPNIRGVNPELAMNIYEKAVEQFTDVTMDYPGQHDDWASEFFGLEDEVDSEPASENLVQETHMLVSSKHLMNASPVFKAMFRKDCFKEGRELQSGRADVTLDDDPPAAFKILMDILHLKDGQVPRRVNFNTLADLAVLVDKYQLLQSVGVWADHWLNSFNGAAMGGDKDVIRQVHKSLSVFWVFRSLRPDRIQSYANHVAIESKSQVNTTTEYDLPTPGPFLDQLETCRQKLISGELGHLKDLINIYFQKKKGRKIICRGMYSEDQSKRRKACDHAMRGSLVASLSNNGLWPLPTAPFQGSSLQSVLERVAAVQLSSGCVVWEDVQDVWYDGHRSSDANGDHGRTKQLTRKLASTNARVDEMHVLDVDDFDTFSSKATGLV